MSIDNLSIVDCNKQKPKPKQTQNNNQIVNTIRNDEIVAGTGW